MKFLLFNVIVASALVYLFGAGPATNVVTDGATVVAAHVGKALDSVRRPGRETSPEKPEPAPSPPPAIVEARDVRTLPAHSAPSPVKTETSPAKAEAAKIMTSKERRRELNRLAHDMELMYVEKTAR